MNRTWYTISAEFHYMKEDYDWYLIPEMHSWLRDINTPSVRVEIDVWSTYAQVSFLDEEAQALYVLRWGSLHIHAISF